MSAGKGLDKDRSDAFFGTGITPVSFEEWLESIADVCSAGRRRFLWGHHNLHSLYLLRRDPEVAAFYRRCDGCYIDGVPVKWILAGAGTHVDSRERFTLMDTFNKVLEQARQRDWVIFYLGSSEEVINAARTRIESEHPGIRIHLHHGYFIEDQPVIDLINSVCPQLLMVGMGMPRQEAWLLDNLDRLDVNVACQAGATLDYFAGVQAKPPETLSNYGLGWLYRLLHDPGRLWRRYLLEPWALVLPTFALWLRSR
jgi:N-acetylglucosaminyldiphosphoundecaprenol N-acetyl-beta-D-mannosaminyltransferase